MLSTWNGGRAQTRLVDPRTSLIVVTSFMDDADPLAFCTTSGTFDAFSGFSPRHFRDRRNDARLGYAGTN
jgi:hypothetical protein